MLKISYNKLWKLLIDKKMSKADLRKAAEIAPNTMTKLRRDEAVSMNILLKIAEQLIKKQTETSLKSFNFISV